MIHHVHSLLIRCTDFNPYNHAQRCYLSGDFVNFLVMYFFFACNGFVLYNSSGPLEYHHYDQVYETATRSSHLSAFLYILISTKIHQLYHAITIPSSSSPSPTPPESYTSPTCPPSSPTKPIEANKTKHLAILDSLFLRANVFGMCCR